MANTSDIEAKIRPLRERLETEIADVRREITVYDELIKAKQAKTGAFPVEERARRSKLQDRLTELMWAHDRCWPNPRFVLTTLQWLYREEPLH
jgi:hypothetical protein